MAIESVERQIFAEELAVEAGLLALSYRDRDDIEVRSKGVLDWVTEADVATEHLIRNRIGVTYPDDQVLGEEGDNDGQNMGANRYTWVVDPIDGTTCFVSGLPSWCVSIACVDDEGHPFLGVIRDPTRAETFSALEGHGVTVNGLSVSVPSKGITDGLVGVGHPRNSPDEPTLEFLRGLFGYGGLFYNSGSAALALAYVAVGRLVGFYESDLRAWDALAGEVLIRESGGWTTEFMRDMSLTTSKPVLAANRGAGSDLWEIARQNLEDCEPPGHGHPR
ncbi:MAG: inositol monophosphatase family protein [Acidimicrobiia bacterium]|nr:MAG: inositol monophosphatase family protein [Acidimicrobiia bacterium]